MKNKINGRKTIIDIANEAKVSIATISRYFNNPNLLSPKTRDKLKSVIEKYAFFPSIISRSKRIKNMVKISYLLEENMRKAFFFGVINGILRGCLIYNYTMMLFLNQKERKEHMNNVIRNDTTYIISTKLQSKNIVNIMKKNNIKFCYLLPLSVVRNRIWKNEDILVTYNDNFNDSFTLGLITISLIKNKLNDNSKNLITHKFIKNDFTFIDFKM